jgi:hypothetical protein
VEKKMRPHQNRPLLFSVLAYIALLLISVSVVSAQETADLTGSWQSKDTPIPINVTLKADGTGTFDDTPIKYKVQGNILSVNEEGTVNNYHFRLTGDSLVVSGGDLDAPMTFVRQRSGRGLGGRLSQPGTGAAPTAATKEKGIVGRWQSSEATVQINDDGTLVLNGETYRYSVKGNTIVIGNNEGIVQLPFQLDGDTMRVVVDGRTVVYKRLEGVQAAESARPAAGANPSELLGKWCYMSNVNANNGGRMSNTCFTLYGNGTFDYYSETSSSGPNGGSASQESDSGTWSVAGGVLTANSRSRGTLTFSLEKRNHPKTGDPMLVLDGDAFVTYSPRAPW